jgi:uncharacterized membrane protein YhaH (DUF805 family)
VGFFLWLYFFMQILPIIFVYQEQPPGPNRFGDRPQPMTFGEAVASFFRNYANFTTRASRSEFWYSVLFWFGTGFIVAYIDPTGILSTIFTLAIIVPSYAVAARRLHDINRSGWHQLLALIAPVGAITVIVWYCRRARGDDATAPAFGRTTMGPVELLERLAKLKEDGAITSEEFEAEKRRILETAG